MTRMLCEILSKLTEEQENTIVYNGRNVKSRKLADWWEKHQEADKKRLAKEEEEVKTQEIKKQALNKLTDNEKKVLGL